ncbi:unnamed protein product, partial [marine sediment metagenome]
TREHRAAIWKQHLLEMFMPLYQAMGRWDLYSKFAGRVGQMLGIENVDDYLPKPEELQQFQQQQQAMQMQEQAQALAASGGATNPSQGANPAKGTNPSPGGTTE